MASSATVNSRIGVGSGGVRAALHALFLLVISTLLSAGTARAELLAVDKRGFLSEHVIEMPASSTRVWEALTAEIDRWWDATHSHGGKASAFSLDAKAGGCFFVRCWTTAEAQSTCAWFKLAPELVLSCRAGWALCSSWASPVA